MKPIILAILDGWGIAKPSQGNAISQANIPNIKYIERNYPSCSLQASGIAVGLPWNESGNSETGHLNIGSGRVVYQYLPRISMEIKNGKFFKNKAFLKTIDYVKKNNSDLHLIGLVSSGNVHSYLEHIYALLELARKEKVKNLYLHLFTDGKDAPLKEGKKVIAALQKKIKDPWKIASIIGRIYAMDRNKSLDRTEKAFNLLTKAQGEKTDNIIEKLEEFYEKDITDTYIEPLVVNEKIIKDKDGVIFFNFREDSARQLTRMLIKKDISFCAMTEYEKGLQSAYPPIRINKHLTEILKKKILKIAETEKYAHVTFFFNGGEQKTYPNEDRELIQSKIVSRYDDIPEMHANKVTEEILKGIKTHDLIIANYANADMMGHTGNFQAGIKAVECLDKVIKPLIASAEKGECILLITSDHGNVEQMIDLQSGEKLTKHTINPVPFYLIGKEYKRTKIKQWKEPQGILSDIAPTILELMEIKKPVEMTGQSLLKILK